MQGRFATPGGRIGRRVMSPADRWTAWRDLAGMAERLARRAVATDGRETIEHEDFKHSLALNAGAKFPVDGASADQAAQAFVHMSRAMMAAATEGRRAILAPSLQALAACIEQLLVDQTQRSAAARCGERPD